MLSRCVRQERGVYLEETVRAGTPPASPTNGLPALAPSRAAAVPRSRARGPRAIARALRPSERAAPRTPRLTRGISVPAVPRLKTANR